MTRSPTDDQEIVVVVSNQAPTLSIDKTLPAILDEGSIGVAFAADKSSASDPAGGTVEFEIVSGNSDRNSEPVFTINTTTGALSINGSIDYDRSPELVGRRGYRIKIRALDQAGAASNTEEVVIFVENGAPSLTMPSSLSLMENFLGSIVSPTEITASDPAGGVLNYAIDKGNGDSIFAIDNATGEITVAGSLDYETALEISPGGDRGHRLTIVATDVGGLFALHVLAITIENSNDEPPIFPPRNSYERFVIEGHTGVIPGPIVATDDLPIDGRVAEQGTIEYSVLLSDGSPSQHIDIDSATGQLRISEATAAAAGIPYTPEPIILMVTATDTDPAIAGQDSIRSSTQEVTIRVNQVGDVYFATADYQFRVDEGATGDFGAPVQALSSGAGTVLQYSIKAPIPSGLEGLEIDPTSGQLRLATPLNYDTQSEYSATIIATNQADASLSAEQEISIIVNNVAPTLLAQNANPIDLVEGTSGVVIDATKITASDPAGGSITYEFVDYSGSLFVIDSASGAIEINGTLSYDNAATRQYRLGVRAVDGDGEASNVEFFEITVKNAAPSIIIPPSVSVVENSAAGVVLSSDDVRASDPGGGVITFSILSGNDSNLFDIDLTDGEITTRAPLDYEVAPQIGAQRGYQLSIGVSDVNEETTAKSLTIYVTDQIDVVPTFTGLAADGRYHARIDLEAVPSSVATINAAQVMASADGPISYEFIDEEGNDDGNIFSINSTTGQISVLLSSLVDTATLIYRLVVVAINNESGVLRDKAEIELIIIRYPDCSDAIATVDCVIVSLGDGGLASYTHNTASYQYGVTEAGDVDLYQWEITNGGEYSIYVAASNPNILLSLKLLDEFGAEMTGGSSEAINQYAADLSLGTYYLSVDGMGIFENYRIFITSVDPFSTLNEGDCDDSKTTDCLLTVSPYEVDLDLKFHETIDGAGDNDWLKIAVASPLVHRFDFELTGASNIPEDASIMMHLVQDATGWRSNYYDLEYARWDDGLVRHRLRPPVNDQVETFYWTPPLDGIYYVTIETLNIPDGSYTIKAKESDKCPDYVHTTGNYGYCEISVGDTKDHQIDALDERDYSLLNGLLPDRAYRVVAEPAAGYESALMHVEVHGRFVLYNPYVGLHSRLAFPPINDMVFVNEGPSSEHPYYVYVHLIDRERGLTPDSGNYREYIGPFPVPYTLSVTEVPDDCLGKAPGCSASLGQTDGTINWKHDKDLYSMAIPPGDYRIRVNPIGQNNELEDIDILVYGDNSVRVLSRQSGPEYPDFSLSLAGDEYNTHIRIVVIGYAGTGDYRLEVVAE